jgi:transcriptional regulator with XRE-family HTH domain
MKAKIIRFAPRRTALSLQLDQLVGFEGVKILSELIREWHLKEPFENTIKKLAQKANLTPTTVSRIMNRDTKSPRMLTCIMLFKALGFSAVRFE